MGDDWERAVQAGSRVPLLHGLTVWVGGGGGARESCELFVLRAPFCLLPHPEAASLQDGMGCWEELTPQSRWAEFLSGPLPLFLLRNAPHSFICLFILSL